jgi:hypothetical protein
MMDQIVVKVAVVLPALLLTSGMVIPSTYSQPAAESSSKQGSATALTPHRPNHVPKRAGEYYNLIWGVDSLSIKAVESGELIRFSYRVIDPDKAGLFNDKKIEAFLDSPAAHARLVIPSLEKVGQLRQINNPQAGKFYWMAFSNPRLTVKRGDHVNVVIGKFHADGLIVE